MKTEQKYPNWFQVDTFEDNLSLLHPVYVICCTYWGLFFDLSRYRSSICLDSWKQPKKSSVEKSLLYPVQIKSWSRTSIKIRFAVMQQRTSSLPLLWGWNWSPYCEASIWKENWISKNYSAAGPISAFESAVSI